jgi:hypothetical protein
MKKPPRHRGGFLFAEGSSTNTTAAVSGGRRLLNSIIVSRRFPSLADLAATYSSKP